MIKTFQRQQGFAHAVIIIGLVIALISALGFIFWQNFIHKEPVVKNDPVVVIKNQAPKSTELQPKTFSIKEYGVQFTIPSGLNDTTIKYEPRQIGEASFLAFTTQRVIDLGGDCAKGYPFGDIVMLSRDSQSNSNAYQVYTSGRINGYYYHVGTVEASGLTPASTCTASEQAKLDENALVSALKTLVPQD